MSPAPPQCNVGSRGHCWCARMVLYFAQSAQVPVAAEPTLHLRGRGCSRCRRYAKWYFISQTPDPLAHETWRPLCWCGTRATWWQTPSFHRRRCTDARHQREGGLPSAGLKAGSLPASAPATRAVRQHIVQVAPAGATQPNQAQVGAQRSTRQSCTARAGDVSRGRGFVGGIPHTEEVVRPPDYVKRWVIKLLSRHSGNVGACPRAPCDSPVAGGRPSTARARARS